MSCLPINKSYFSLSIKILSLSLGPDIEIIVNKSMLVQNSFALDKSLLK